MLLTCASRYSKCGHRKTMAGFEFRSSSTSRSKATSCVHWPLCCHLVGSNGAAIAPALQLRPGQHPWAAFLQCLLLKHTSNSSRFQHLPGTKIKFITLMLVSHGLQLQWMKYISIQVLLPASVGTVPSLSFANHPQTNSSAWNIKEFCLNLIFKIWWALCFWEVHMLILQ